MNASSKFYFKRLWKRWRSVEYHSTLILKIMSLSERKMSKHFKINVLIMFTVQNKPKLYCI